MTECTQWRLVVLSDDPLNLLIGDVRLTDYKLEVLPFWLPQDITKQMKCCMVNLNQYSFEFLSHATVGQTPQSGVSFMEW